MNDEATPHYTDVIDQMTLGHEFLFREFGVRPSIGWHIGKFELSRFALELMTVTDPFGHSAAHPALFSNMGFDGFFFARVDYQDHDLRNSTNNLEFIWRGMKSYGTKSDIFTGILYGKVILLSLFNTNFNSSSLLFTRYKLHPLK